METARANSARLWLYFHCLASTLSKPATCFITKHAGSLIDSTAFLLSGSTNKTLPGAVGFLFVPKFIIE